MEIMWPKESNIFGCTLLLCLALLQEGVRSLNLLSVDIPSHVHIGHTVILKCLFELGNDELYSVKWYRGKDEFYRYVPKDKPPGQVFSLEGFKVNQTASNSHQVVLANVGIAASGEFRCEVSAEAPSFHTDSISKKMIIIDPPHQGPKISGGQSQYNIGEAIRVNCSTIQSSPAATLEWFINGKKAPDTALRFYPIISHQDGLNSKVLGLEFYVYDQHFQDDGLRLQCVASFHPFYSVSSEQSITKRHPSLSVLDIKEEKDFKRVGIR
uniref:Ig-like domain-containing protein n=1 Tax=Strigamia maritima TaxID=126957 RepID=T1J658_STRMM